MLTLRPLVALIVVAAACQPSETPEQAAARMTEESAAARTPISEAVQAFTRQMSAGHYDSVVAHYTNDAVVMGPNMPAMVGREAILAGFQGMGAAGSFTLRITTDMVSANGPMAVESGRFWSVFTPTGGPAMPDSGKFLAHWRLTDAGWRMAHDIWNSDIPLPGMP